MSPTGDRALQPKHVPLTGIEPGTLHSAGWHPSTQPNQLGLPWCCCFFTFIYIARVEWCKTGSTESYQVKYLWRGCFTLLVWNKFRSYYSFNFWLFIMVFICLSKLSAKINSWNTDSCFFFIPEIVLKDISMVWIISTFVHTDQLNKAVRIWLGEIF